MVEVLLVLQTFVQALVFVFKAIHLVLVLEVSFDCVEVCLRNVGVGRASGEADGGGGYV